jgi:hypothetical protein
MRRMRCAAPVVAFDPPSGFALGSAGGSMVCREKPSFFCDTSCPSGTAPVLGPAECQKSAAAAARPYGGAVIVKALPAGCFWLTIGVGGFFFNTYVGAGSVYAQPVCAGAP